MTTRTESARRVEKDIVNAGAPTQGNQAPPQSNQSPFQEQAPQGDKVLVIRLAMIDREIRLDFQNSTQSMTT